MQKGCKLNVFEPVRAKIQLQLWPGNRPNTVHPIKICVYVCIWKLNINT